MEPPLPVLVVGPDTPAPGLLESLRADGLDPRPCSEEEVLGLLGAGVAEAVLARPLPGWRLLLSRVVTSGATAVLQTAGGPLPRALPAGVVAVASAGEVAHVLREARARRGSEGAPAQIAPTLEQRLAEAERFSAEVQALHLMRTPEELAWEAVRRVRGLVQADRVL